MIKIVTEIISPSRVSRYCICAISTVKKNPPISGTLSFLSVFIAHHSTHIINISVSFVPVSHIRTTHGRQQQDLTYLYQVRSRCVFFRLYFIFVYVKKKPTYHRGDVLCNVQKNSILHLLRAIRNMFRYMMSRACVMFNRLQHKILERLYVCACVCIGSLCVFFSTHFFRNLHCFPRRKAPTQCILHSYTAQRNMDSRKLVPRLSLSYAFKQIYDNVFFFHFCRQILQNPPNAINTFPYVINSEFYWYLTALNARRFDRFTIERKRKKNNTKDNQSSNDCRSVKQSRIRENLVIFYDENIVSKTEIRYIHRRDDTIDNFFSL